MNRVCDDCTGRCEELHGKKIRVPVHRFFKFVLHEHHSQYMHLPPEFARRVKHLSIQETRIEDSDGEKWPVTLSNVEGSLAFQKGWEKFYSDHGLKFGQVLFFNYIEGSHFTVCIFSKSACERTHFNNEMSHRSKRRRRDIGPDSENESNQTAGVNSKDKPISASGNEFLNHNVNHVAENADANKASGNLSSMIPGITKKLMELQQMLDQVAGPIHTETGQNVVISENTSGAKVNLSGNGLLEPTNPEGDDIPLEQTKIKAMDAEMPVVDTDPVTKSSGDSSTKKSEKALVGKTADSHTEIAEQISKKVDDTLMSPHSSQGGGHYLDASTKKSSEKPSDTCKMKMGMLNNGKHGSFSASPSIGTNKIAERELTVKSKFDDFMCSSAVKSPIEQRTIKKEVEMDDKLSRGGNEPAKVLNYTRRTPPVTNNSGDSSTKKSEKALVGKTADSHTEIIEQISKKVDDTLMAPHSSQGGGHSLDASMKKLSEKLPDTCEVKMGMLNNVSDFKHGKHGSVSASPSKGTNMIAEKKLAVKSKFGDSVFSSADKNPIEPRVIKNEVEMDAKANASRQLARVGNEPARTPLVVKDEPDLCEIDQLDAINALSTCPFKAEVKSQPYLELPLPIDVPSCRLKQRKHLITYLRESTRKLWPVAYVEYHSGRALTINWTKFCEQNNIEPGNECRFQVVDLDSSIFKVDITRGSA